MRQIAAQAGVSPTTVAHVLNRTQGACVADATRERVLIVAQAMGYQEAMISQSIKAPLRHLGMVISDHPASRGDAMEIFEGVRQEASRHDYMTVVLPMAPEVVSHYSSDNAANTIRQLHRTRIIDGFVIDKSCFLSDPLRRLCQQGVPMLTVNGSLIFLDAADKAVPIPASVVDNRTGGRLAVQHLLALGHRTIGLLTRPWAAYPQDYRPYPMTQIVRGYEEAHRHVGLPVDHSLILDASDQDRDKTYAAVDELLGRHPALTAIFAADDAIAVMVIHALQRLKKRVPQDVSVVGFGDWSHAGRLSEPRLTSIHTDLQATGVLAARSLIALLGGQALDVPHQQLIPTLHEGESAGPPRRDGRRASPRARSR